MISKQDKFTHSQLIQHLYAQTLLVSLANPFVAAALAWAFWGVFDAQLMYQWLIVVVAFTGARALGFILLKRKLSEDADISSLANFHIIVSLLLGITYGAAFVSVIVLGEVQNTSLVLACMIALSACLSIGTGSSFKTALAFNIPLLLGTAFAFIATMQVQAFVMSAIILAYLGILSVSIISQHNTLSQLFAQKFADAQLLSDQKNKLISYQDLIIKDRSIGIYNRNFFDYVLGAEVHRAKRAGNNLILIMVKVDAFDDYKTHYTQEQTIKCTRRIAGLLQTLVHRGGETVSLYDDSTFGLVLPNIGKEQAMQFSKKISKKFAEAKIPNESPAAKRYGHITLSMAISEFSHQHPIDTKSLVDMTLDAARKIEHKGGNDIEIIEIESDVLDISNRVNKA
jgi:diguanylate cyclase (GGDEF)-like protein